MKTITKTEIAVMGLMPDGKWRAVTSKRFGNVVDAQDYIGEYIKDAERHPNVFPAFAEYKIAKRTVTTTFTDWEDV